MWYVLLLLLLLLLLCIVGATPVRSVAGPVCVSRQAGHLVLWYPSGVHADARCAVCVFCATSTLAFCRVASCNCASFWRAQSSHARWLLSATKRLRSLSTLTMRVASWNVLQVAHDHPGLTVRAYVPVRVQRMRVCAYVYCVEPLMWGGAHDMVSMVTAPPPPLLCTSCSWFTSP